MEFWHKIILRRMFLYCHGLIDGIDRRSRSLIEQNGEGQRLGAERGILGPLAFYNLHSSRLGN
jgi:hypothetical protein